MRDTQTNFATKLAPLGLQRGVEGSQAQHQEVKRFYGLVKELNPQLKQQGWSSRRSARWLSSAYSKPGSSIAAVVE